MRTELVTTLRRQATEILNDLEKDREPILITQHGVPSAYLVDVETFETLQRRMTLLEGIARGEKAIEEGRSLTHKQARQRMSRWLKEDSGRVLILHVMRSERVLSPELLKIDSSVVAAINKNEYQEKRQAESSAAFRL